MATRPITPPHFCDPYDNCCGRDLPQAKLVFKEVSNSDSKWDHRFLDLADHISFWSKDPSTKCGAVIVDDKQRIISTGYNGFARGIEDSDERLLDRETKYALTLHAEVNAIMFANTSLEGCTIYTTPLAPCIRCAVQIVQAGIKTVVTRKMIPQHVKRWGESVQMSKKIFAEAGVKFIEIG